MAIRASYTDKIEEILRSRTYDEHAYDAETFEELLDEIDVVVMEALTDHPAEGD